MSNETKQDVFTRVNKFARELRVYDPERMESKNEIDRDYQEYMSAYDAALPDDLPVIPMAVGEYIEEVKAHEKLSIIDPLWRVGDALSAMGESGLGDRARWVLHHSDAFATAWLLGVWRVEETGEIVKLEAENE